MDGLRWDFQFVTPQLTALVPHLDSPRSSREPQGGEVPHAMSLPVSVTVLNQSNSFSKQVSSATSCLGSARTAQRAGRSLEHSGSMIRAVVPTEEAMDQP